MPQDANRLNRMQIREQEQLNRERRAQNEAEERRKTEAMRSSKSQFNHVRSHGYGATASGDSTRSGGGDDAEIRVYVRECDAENARSYSYRESEGIAEAVAAAGPSRPTQRPHQQQQQRLPPVQRVPRQVSVGSATEVPGLGAAAPNKGRVPRYLTQRKAEMAAEKASIEDEAERRRELAKIPPGHRLVSEQEKAETVARLDARQAELEGQLGKIPIRFDTQAIRTRRGNIEEELRQIESTRAKYNTKKPLYVPLQ